MSLRQSLGDVSGTLLSIFRTRFELFAIEFNQQRTVLLRLIMLAFGALLFLTLALLVFTLLIALLFWPTGYRYWALAILIAAYTLIGLLLVLRILHRLRTGPYPFQASIEELRRDVNIAENLRQHSKRRE